MANTFPRYSGGTLGRETRSCMSDTHRWINLLKYLLEGGALKEEVDEGYIFPLMPFSLTCKYVSE